MVQSPSWAANWFAASKEIPRISRNPKVHYRTHKRPPSVSILGQLNPVHIPTSHRLQSHPNITHPSTPRSPQWSLSLRFPHQDPIHPPLLTHTRHMPNPSHSSHFTFTRLGWMVNATLRPLYPRDSPCTHCIGGWVVPRTGLNRRRNSLHPTRIRSPDMLLFIFTLFFLMSALRGTISGPVDVEYRVTLCKPCFCQV
jgi:hypothetical protein